MASILNWLGDNVGNALGNAADAVIPGNQAFLHPASRPQPQPIQNTIGTINRATGFNNTPTRMPAPVQPYRPPVQSQPFNLGNVAAHFNPLNIPLPGTGVNIGQVASQLPRATAQAGVGVAHGAYKAADMFVGGAAHLGHVIDYPIQEAQYRDLMNKGQISPDTYLQLTKQAADQAGIQQSDSGFTLARKVGAAVASPAAAILTAGLAPKIASGASLAAKALQGVKVGAPIGAGFGALGTLQQDQITPLSAATNILGGGVAGAALGVAAPVIGAAAKVGSKVATDAYKGSPLASQGGYIKVGYPDVNKLPPDLQAKILPDSLSANKLGTSDRSNLYYGTPAGHGTFDQTTIKAIANNIPSFKQSPVMTFDPAYSGADSFAPGASRTTYPALVYTSGKDHFAIRADNYFPQGTDLSHIPKGEQVDMSAALGKGANKIPVITEQKIGQKLLPTDQTGKPLRQANIPTPKIPTPKIAPAVAPKEATPLGLPSGAITQTVKARLAAATQYDPAFKTAIDSAAKDLNAGGGELATHHGPVKTFASTMTKVNKDYGGDITRLKDDNRSTYISHHDLSENQTIRPIVERLQQDHPVVGTKSSFGQPNTYNAHYITVKTPHGLAEVQVTTPEMLRAKEELGGHFTYKAMNALLDKNKSTWTAAEKQAYSRYLGISEKVYGKAQADAASRLNSSSVIRLPSRTNLAKLTETGRPSGLETAKPPSAVSSMRYSRESSSLKTQKAGYVAGTDMGSPSGPNIPQIPAKGKGAPVPEPNVPGKTGKRAGVARINRAMGTNLPESLYTKRPQAALRASSEARAKNLDTFTGKVQKDLAQTPGRLTDQQLSDAYLAAERHAEAGNIDLSNELLTKTLAHDTRTAQALAARGMMTKATPMGMQKMVLDALAKAKIPFEGDLKDRILTRMEAVKGSAAGTPERELAVRQLANEVTQHLPRGKVRAIGEFWRAMLLSGPQTAAKVAISQPFSAVQAYLKQYPAGAFDAARSAVTGAPRTTAITPFKGLGSGLKSGGQAGGVKLRTGVDVPGSGGFVRSFESQLQSSRHQTLPERTIFNLHSAIQKPVYEAIRNNTLAGLAKAQAINQGLKGAERSAFIDNYIKNPPQEAYAHALSAGEQATNQQRTMLGDLAGKIQSAGGKNGNPGPGLVIAPITRVPGAIATNALYNYSGLKFAKTAIVDGLVKHGKTPDFSRTMAEDFGKAVVGAGGVIGLGALLGATGNVTPGKFASTKDAALAKAQGKPAGSIHIPGTGVWLSLNAMGPLGIELATGAGFGEGGPATALASGGQELAQQPYLQGITGVGNALNAPKQYAASFVNNLVGSTIPAFFSQIASGTDTNQRQTNYSSPTDVLKSRIPGVRETIPAAPDVLGGVNAGANPSGTVLGGIAGTLDALKPSLAKGTSDPVTTELARLNDTLPAADSPAISLPKRDQNILGQPIKLNDQQLSDYIQQSGDLIKQGVGNLIQTPEYQGASDLAKAKAVNDIITAAHDNAKTNMGTGSNALIDSSKLTQKAILAVAKDSFNSSGKNYQVVGDTVLRRDEQGNITATPKVKFDYQVGTATMTQQKNNNDLSGWMQTAQKQLQSIQTQLQDPSVDPLDALTLQNDATRIATEAAKYRSYGGFTKGRTARALKIPKFSTALMKTPHMASFKVAKPPKAHVATAHYKVPKIPKMRVLT